MKNHSLKTRLMGGIAIAVLASGGAYAANFDIPGGDLAPALDAYQAQSGIPVVVAANAVRNVKTRGVKGDLPAEAALTKILKGTGFVATPGLSGVMEIVPAPKKTSEAVEPVTRVADAVTPAHAAAGVETVVVTSSKIKGDIQTVPIAITALSQEQLTSRQIAGGPDLVKEVPNLTFSKTNFSGYTIQIRGIGTQAISVTTDPAVAVALNDIPFIRNHFFEQEFFDVNQVEVLRGPQGTLYGRNATAGVVNVITAKPTDQFEAMLSADWGNYLNRRYEGMVNIPLVDDRVDLRVAGEWTKRDGYTTNTLTGSQVDGRDLWSTRVTLGWKPSEKAQVYLVWEHFQESDDRMRTSKQLCKTDPGPTSVGGVHVPTVDEVTAGSSGFSADLNAVFSIHTGYLSQGCLPASLYSSDSFEVPNGYALPYVVAGWFSSYMNVINPYVSTVQSHNLRDIETQIDPRYNAKNNTLELNADYEITPALTFSSQTGYNQDFLYSTEDYNRFNTTPGMFIPDTGSRNIVGSDGTFCDPQLGCSTRLVAQDVSSEHAWQASQEFRLASNFKGPFNFSVGGNYMHYETVEDYYVFANSLTLFAVKTGSAVSPPWDPGVTDNLSGCLSSSYTSNAYYHGGYGQQYNDPNIGAGDPIYGCFYIDPNPLSNLNGEGHNYFLSRNPYVLNSYAGFGEAYYNLRPDLKLTGGIRWTNDQKHFIDIPSELLASGYGYASIATVDQQWNQLTGRLAANWTPKLDFTDQTLIYGSFAHGYKAGGANPPGADLFAYGGKGAGLRGVPDHPLTFKPEFVDAYELGSKNTLLDGDVFFYNYSGYQISRIVDRTSINDNFNATVKGAELEAMWEPLPGLKFNFAGGYEDTRIKDGQSSIDLMDRTAGHPGWVLMKPFVTEPSNCVLPEYVVAALIYSGYSEGNDAVSACGTAYYGGLDPVVNGTYESSWAGANDPTHHLVTGQPYYISAGLSGGNFGYPITYADNSAGHNPNPIVYTGFDPCAGDPANPGCSGNEVYSGQNTYGTTNYGPAPNDGEGFAKPLGGNQLPNAPHFTASLSGEYTIPVSEDWAATLHSDFYWQSQSFARVFNDRPYDKIRGYSNVNLALILTSASGWQVMGYLKNVFDTTAITGDFLNSDDSGLTTNVFLTDPRLFGVRVTKNW